MFRDLAATAAAGSAGDRSRYLTGNQPGWPQDLPLTKVLQPQSELRHVVLDVGLYRPGGGDIAVAARLVAFEVAGQASAEQGIRIVGPPVQVGIVVGNGLVGAP